LYLCLCKGVTEAQVLRLARAGNTSAEALARALGLRDKRLCGRCIRDIAEFVALAASDRAAANGEWEQ